MRTRSASFWICGLALAVGCGGSDDGEGGTGGSGAGSGTGGGAATAGTGATGTGATGTGATGSGGDAGAAAGTGTGGAGTGGSSTGGSGAGAPCVQATCQGKLYQCGDCIDNDNDGKIDSNDPDCFGVCDNNESGLKGNIPGQANQPCMHDCYFDQDGGQGNDQCYWDHRCDPLEPENGCSYSASTMVIVSGGPPWTCDYALNNQKQACLDYCGPMVPNGCDCFGCCNVPGASTPIWLGSNTNGTGTCSIADAADPTKCAPCTIVKGCFNDCKHCELCLGKTTLPADCTNTGTGGSPGTGGTGGSSTGGSGGTGGACIAPLCPTGIQPCGVDCLPGCPTGTYCVTGCCQPVPA